MLNDCVCYLKVNSLYNYDFVVMLIPFLGIQAIEATTIVPRDVIGALKEEEPHQGNITFLNILVCCKLYISSVDVIHQLKRFMGK